MPRLTVPPNFTGTAGDDTLIGEDLNKFPAIGIDILTGGFIYTGLGKDTIKGNGTSVKGLMVLSVKTSMAAKAVLESASAIMAI